MLHVNEVVATGTEDRVQAVTGGTAIFTIEADHVVAPELLLHIHMVWEGGAATICVGSTMWLLHWLSFPKCGIGSFGNPDPAKAQLLNTKRPPIRPANERYKPVFICAFLVGRNCGSPHRPI